MIQTAKTLALVTVVTLLIWVWAEGESVSRIVLTPPVVFVDDGGNSIIKTDEDWRGSVRVRLEGSTLALNAAQRLLGGVVGPVRLHPGQPGVPSGAGDRQSVNLVEALRSLPELKREGVSVVDCDPQSVVVRIITLATREVPVRVEMPGDVELQGEPTVSPARVLLRYPASRAPAEGATAVAVVGPEELTRLRDDASQTLSVPVRLPAALAGVEGASVVPEKASVTLRLKKNVETLSLASVPVWISIPPTEGSKWDIQLLTEFLTEVTVTGPRDQIKRIKDREVVPVAEVRLTSDELESRIATKEAVVTGLPPGVDYAVVSRSVRLKVTPREGAKEGPNGGRGPGLEGGD